MSTITRVRRWLRPLRPAVDWCRQEAATCLYVCVLELPARTPPTLPAGVEPRLLTPGDHLSPPLRRALRAGHWAVGAWYEEQLIFRSLAALGPRTLDLEGYPLALTIEDAYLYCTETHPAWRGQGVAPAMAGFLARTLLARGITRAFLAIAPTNTASRHSIEKSGARPILQYASTRHWGRWRVEVEEHILVQV